MRRTALALALAALASCTPRTAPTHRALAALEAPSRHTVCLNRCEHRMAVKPDNGPLTCGERCAEFQGR